VPEVDVVDETDDAEKTAVSTEAVGGIVCPGGWSDETHSKSI